MKKYLLSTIVFISLFSVVTTANAATKRQHYEGRWGARLTVEGGYYNGKGSIAQTSGAFIPLQLEGTYSVTNAFELLAGLRYAFSFQFQLPSGDNYNLQSIGATIGYRYYFNVEDPVKFFFSNQLSTGFLRPSLEGRANWGLHWDITDMFAIFLQLGTGAAIQWIPTGDPILQALLNIGTGLQVRF